MTDIKELTKGIRNCECGRDHDCPIDIVEIGNNVLPKIAQFSEGFCKILLVADQNTYAACGQRVEQYLFGKVANKVVFQTGDKLLIPDENAIGAMEAAVCDQTDLIVGVGSGVINDLCKHVSFSRGLPCYIVATAPSMDGYASVGAALILKG